MDRVENDVNTTIEPFRDKKKSGKARDGRKRVARLSRAG
jgi:hypothetical protein